MTPEAKKRLIELEWKVPQVWPKSNIIIIGGGPSFKQVDQSILRELSISNKIKVIGVNKAYTEIPDSNEWMHVLWFGDDKFYKSYARLPEKNLYTFPGLKLCCCPSASRDKYMKYLERDRRKGPGISTNPKAICWNKNSGGSAINLAYHLGGSESTVYLFGFDMSKGPNGEGNWHKGYAELWNGKTVAMIAPFKRWLATFALIARDAKKLGLNIVNVNLDSKIEEFPKISFEEFVSRVNPPLMNAAAPVVINSSHEILMKEGE